MQISTILLFKNLLLSDEDIVEICEILIHLSLSVSEIISYILRDVAGLHSADPSSWMDTE